MVKKGPRPLVICGPSGVGKSTLLKKLFEEFPETFGFSVSHTTRKPRPGEKEGVHYHYVSIEEMRRAIECNEFLEHAMFADNMYGTSKKAVKNVQDLGKVCVLDIDIEGVKQLRKTDLDPLLVFVCPPTLEELENRLKLRKSETIESLKKRLDVAKNEIEYGKQGNNFHIVIHNIDVDNAYKKLRNFIVKELQTQRDEGTHVILPDDIDIDSFNKH